MWIKFNGRLVNLELVLEVSVDRELGMGHRVKLHMDGCDKYLECGSGDDALSVVNHIRIRLIEAGRLEDIDEVIK